MGKELRKNSTNAENDIRIYKSRTPRVGDVVVICGDIAPVIYTDKEGHEWLNAIPVLVCGVPSVLPLSTWGQATFDGDNCFPQNKWEVTELINSATTWEALCGLSSTPMIVREHFNFKLQYKDAKRGSYNWTAIGCEWAEGADHTFSEGELNALKSLVAEAQAKISK